MLGYKLAELWLPANAEPQASRSRSDRLAESLFWLQANAEPQAPSSDRLAESSDKLAELFWLQANAEPQALRSRSDRLTESE